ncbi:hypothetical protein ACFSE1_18165 [Rhizobium helianthi]|uniref:Uncharacterized protein n=1 Tax=Rhizobium helianthi TaxID=1132695 RepID=A0ABW4M835_9HYPH
MNRQRSTFSLCNVAFGVAERPILAPLTLHIPIEGGVVAWISE